MATLIECATIGIMAYVLQMLLKALHQKTLAEMVGIAGLVVIFVKILEILNQGINIMNKFM